MTDDFRAQLRQAWTEEHGHAPNWVDEILIDTYAEHMDAAIGRMFGDVVDWKPLGLLGVDVAPWLADELDLKGVSPIRAALERARPHSTPPAALCGPAGRHDTARGAASMGAAEEQRVARELVPLVRTAAAEPAIGDVPKLDADLAELKFFTSRSPSDHNVWVAQSTQDAHDEYMRSLPTNLVAAFDAMLAGCVNPIVHPAPASDAPDLYETVLAAMDKMLAPTHPPRRVEPIKLTREQIDQLPKVDTDEYPFTPTSFRLDGIPVVEVLTVEESTPHAEGWCLTVSQIVTGVYSAFDGVRPDYRKPLHMTRQQIERVMALAGLERPDDWEQTLERGGEVSQLLGRPVHLAYNAASSTPCIERWMDL